MFTGIIEAQGLVIECERRPEAMRVRINLPFMDLTLGESIAINGACLTLAEIASTPHTGTFFISSETLDKTNLGKLHVHASVNLERAVTLQTRLSGHMVQGHVDGIATLVQVSATGESYQMKWKLPSELLRYCVPKGSITLNGISLTINALSDASGILDVMIIPHTWTQTNLCHLPVGDPVNVEVDILAKYVERLCQTSSKPSAT